MVGDKPNQQREAAETFVFQAALMPSAPAMARCSWVGVVSSVPWLVVADEAAINTNSEAEKRVIVVEVLVLSCVVLRTIVGSCGVRCNCAVTSTVGFLN